MAARRSMTRSCKIKIGTSSATFSAGASGAQPETAIRPRCNTLYGLWCTSARTDPVRRSFITWSYKIRTRSRKKCRNPFACRKKSGSRTTTRRGTRGRREHIFSSSLTTKTMTWKSATREEVETTIPVTLQAEPQARLEGVLLQRQPARPRVRIPPHPQTCLTTSRKWFRNQRSRLTGSLSARRWVSTYTAPAQTRARRGGRRRSYWAGTGPCGCGTGGAVERQTRLCTTTNGIR
ncbi:unnamed protein product [Amoebophrya sp. A120]|nr:unnamed protein product [Amoebophrya sp. A120]|eukprot:GSA120T00025011001.1